MRQRGIPGLRVQRILGCRQSLLVRNIMELASTASSLGVYTNDHRQVIATRYRKIFGLDVWWNQRLGTLSHTTAESRAWHPHSIVFAFVAPVAFIAHFSRLVSFRPCCAGFNERHFAMAVSARGTGTRRGLSLRSEPILRERSLRIRRTVENTTLSTEVGVFASFFSCFRYLHTKYVLVAFFFPVFSYLCFFVVSCLGMIFVCFFSFVFWLFLVIFVFPYFCVCVCFFFSCNEDVLVVDTRFKNCAPKFYLVMYTYQVQQRASVNIYVLP